MAGAKLWPQSGLWCQLFNLDSDISKLTQSKTRKIGKVKQTTIYGALRSMNAYAKCMKSKTPMPGLVSQF